jgi:tetratricopeptide (TPR) repeat protein
LAVYSLSLNYERVGKVFEAQGKLPEALNVYEQSLKIRQHLAEYDPTNVGWYKDFSENYDRVGNVLLAQGKLQEALDVYQQGLQMRRRLASRTRRDLPISYEKVGDVLVAQGKLKEALDAFQQSLNIRRTLAEQDKSNAALQRDLILSLHRLAKVTAKIGGNDNVRQAQAFLREGLNLAELYGGPDRQNLIDALDQTLQNLAH